MNDKPLVEERSIDTELTYQLGLPEEHFEEAAELYESAFGQKFSHAIRHRSDRIFLLRQGFRSNHAIAAFDRSRLVGLAGYQTPSGSFTSGMTGRPIINRLGVIRGAWACLIFTLYERNPAPGELVMDGIAVHPNYRGRGIGTELLHHVVSFAVTQGYRSVRLDVININPRARQLYERFGFRVTREENYPYLTWLLGFGGSATMEYEIEAAS